MLSRIIDVADIVDDVFIIDEEDGIKIDIAPKGLVNGWSCFSGILEQTGIKNAKRKMVKKAKSLDCNVVFITSVSYTWGPKFMGKAYKIE